jgi:hypothetical protein
MKALMAIRYSSNSRGPIRKSDGRGGRPRTSSMDEILKYGSCRPSEHQRLAKFRMLRRTFAIDFAPSASAVRARHYLDASAKIAGYAAGEMESILTHPNRAKSVTALSRLARLVQEYVDGRRQLPVTPKHFKSPIVADKARVTGASPHDGGAGKGKQRCKAKPSPRTFSGSTRKIGSHRSSR